MVGQAPISANLLCRPEERIDLGHPFARVLRQILGYLVPIVDHVAKLQLGLNGPA
jgi:hypothetical protein